MVKTLGLVVCNIAIALGILFGRWDYEAERTAHEEEQARAEQERQAQEESANRSRRAAREATVVRVFRGGGDAPTDDMLAPAGPRGETGRAGPPGSSPVSSLEARPPAEPADQVAAFRGRLDKLKDLFQSHDFDGIEKAARAIAEETSTGPISIHDKALQAMAKARAFRRVAGPLLAKAPAESAVGAAPAKRSTEKALELKLANGATVTGKLIDQDAQGFVVRLPSGATFAPRREDVLEAREVEREASAPAAWTDIEPKIAKLAHPIDIYVDGVERCYRMGLRKEGLQVLERLLERPDSDQVPLLFVADADEALLHDWQVAAGRRSPVETAGAPPAASVSGDSEVGDSTAGRGSSSGLKEAEAAFLARAGKLYDEAQGLFQASAGKDGKGDDLRKARERLQEAREILEGLPPEDAEVKAVRRKLVQLISDVARSSPF
jgi:hypothetical protein